MDQGHILSPTDVHALPRKYGNAVYTSAKEWTLVARTDRRSRIEPSRIVIFGERLAGTGVPAIGHVAIRGLQSTRNILGHF